MSQTGPAPKLRSWLPKPNAHDWNVRHRMILWLLWLQLPPLAIFGLYMDQSLLVVSTEMAALAIPGAIATIDRFPNLIREVAATVGLLTTSAVLVSITGGVIEAHFHFFVMMCVITLYQSWIPFIVAIIYVLVHHGLLGTLNPESVYNHAAALDSPWKWAGIHAAFILAASFCSLLAWRPITVAEAKTEEATRQLEESNRELDETNSELRQFTQMASHDLQAPLRTISGFGTVLQRNLAPGQLTEEQAALLDQMVSGSAQMQQTIRDLLAYARLEDPDRESVSVDVLAVYNDVIGLLSHDLDFVDAVLVNHIEPGTYVKANRAQFQQLLQNLIQNSINHRDQEKALVITTTAFVARELGDSEGRAMITIADTGVGIPLDQQARVFEPFQKAATSNGTGMGLAICGRIVARHHGSIAIDSDGYSGTTVRLWLPAAAAPPTSTVQLPQLSREPREPSVAKG